MLAAQFVDGCPNKFYFQWLIIPQELLKLINRRLNAFCFYKRVSEVLNVRVAKYVRKKKKCTIMR